MEKQSFQEMAHQSEETFRKQFDPNSATYHGGPTTVVPLNGERIPQSMKSMYPEGYDLSKSNENIDYGENYKKIEETRNIYLNLKKSLAALCPVVEALFRLDLHSKEKGDSLVDKQLKVHEQNVKKQKGNLIEITNQLNGFILQLEDIGEDGKITAKELRQVINQSSNKYENKEALTNFNFKVKKISTQVFSNAQKCLQKLKDIKKEYVSNAKKQDNSQQKKTD